jgi:demethylmenaquinone methyltransferase/2-methoxy-6-polyprenyl-1,4-benzoquinol methylase
VLEIAREKGMPRDRVTFAKADAITLEGVPAGCDAAFAGFWWSHVKKSELNRFVANLRGKLESGACVVMLDNTFAQGSSTPVSRRDAEGNTYQMRHLANGEEYEVLKNFPAPEELRSALEPVASQAHLETLRYYWLFVAKLK